MSPTLLEALAEAERACGADLTGRRWRLAPTGHIFTALSVRGADMIVRDKRDERALPLRLVREAHEAGLLEEIGF